jgi:hypothetical protein
MFRIDVGQNPSLPHQSLYQSLRINHCLTDRVLSNRCLTDP